MLPGAADRARTVSGWCSCRVAGKNPGMAEGTERWWYNVKTGQVEPDDDHGPNRDVLGPYSSKEDAARALEIARERTEKWDREDREWENR
jgi:hypothetical protein